MSQDPPGGAGDGPGSAGRADGAHARGGFRAEVSLDRCTGTGRCVLVAPTAFRFTQDLVSEFDPHGGWTRAQVRAAADACPMSAITLFEDEPHHDGQDDGAPAGRGAS